MTTASSVREIRKPLTIIQRIVRRDKTVAVDCMNAYGNFIWTLARKFTASVEEAESAAQEIFKDIWLYSERANDPEITERVLIEQIARRRLLKRLQ